MFDLYFKKTVLLYFLILAVTLMFSSYGETFKFHPSQGFMQNFYEMWKPSFNILPVGWTYILFVPYTLFIIVFIRNIDSWFEIIVVVTFTIIYSIIYANARMREPLMPILILWFSRRLTKHLISELFGWAWEQENAEII